mgnify:CR=1 FL=1
MEIDNALFVIPARGGSKGIPYKNIKPLNGKPLIYYTLDAASGVTTNGNICVSSDDDKIIKKVEDYGINVKFKRPSSLATDSAGTYEVLLHALDQYEQEYKYLVLLQATSPFRKSQHVREAFQLMEKDVDMVVSVVESKSNPYYNLFEENDEGFLEKSKKGDYTRRQDCPKVWEYNGAIYVIRVESLRTYRLTEMPSIIKYVMQEIESIDIDTEVDFLTAEFLLQTQSAK